MENVKNILDRYEIFLYRKKNSYSESRDTDSSIFIASIL